VQNNSLKIHSPVMRQELNTKPASYALREDTMNKLSTKTTVAITGVLRWLIVGIVSLVAATPPIVSILSSV
jgi:hypothetical protein